MSTLSEAGAVVAILIYFFLCFQVLTGKSKQNFATWALWAMIDAIAATTIIIQGGNYLLPAIYSLGSAAVTLSILRSKNFAWTWFETMVACFVVICLVVWGISGPWTATIASTLAMVIAGIPLTVESYRRPWEQSFFIYLGYTVANILSTFGGKDWSVEERFYPASCFILCLIIVVFTSRKFWMQRAPQDQSP